MSEWKIDDFTDEEIVEMAVVVYRASVKYPSYDNPHEIADGLGWRSAVGRFFRTGTTGPNIGPVDEADKALRQKIDEIIARRFAGAKLPAAGRYAAPEPPAPEPDWTLEQKAKYVQMSPGDLERLLREG